MDRCRQIVIFILPLIVLQCAWAQENEAVRNSKEPYTKTVALDGSGDYTSIQQAINDSKSFPYERITIFIKNGLYHEKVKVHEWNTNLSLVGESKEKTIISYDDYFNKINLGINSTFHTYTVLVEGDGFIGRNLTIENTSGEVGQAVALNMHADRAALFNCRLLGNQDTVYVTGSGFRQYFKDCYIQGTTDFIFGSATVLFQNCTIHSLKDSFITAASTPEGIAFGFVFDHCRLTAEPTATAVYLGRPWRIHAKTVFMNCTMGAHIRPEGWHNWKKPEAETTSFYAEYNNTGSGAASQARVGWSRQLTAKAARAYTAENILGKTFSDQLAAMRQ